MSNPQPQLVIRIGESVFRLHVAPKVKGECRAAWSSIYQDLSGVSSVCDGLANTRAMAESGIEVAQWALDLVIDGYSDWYIPSRNELELLYRHYKPTDEINHAGRAGVNASSEPAGAPYTNDLPTRTTEEGFRSGEPDAFDDVWYWSSTQLSRLDAGVQHFDHGIQGGNDKGCEGMVRLVRRILID